MPAFTLGAIPRTGSRSRTESRPLCGPGCSRSEPRWRASSWAPSLQPARSRAATQANPVCAALAPVHLLVNRSHLFSQHFTASGSRPCILFRLPSRIASIDCPALIALRHRHPRSLVRAQHHPSTTACPRHHFTLFISSLSFHQSHALQLLCIPSHARLLTAHASRMAFGGRILPAQATPRSKLAVICTAALPRPPASQPDRTR